MTHREAPRRAPRPRVERGPGRRPVGEQLAAPGLDSLDPPALGRRDLPEQGRGELVWRSAAHDDPETLYRLWSEAVGRSTRVLREVLLDRGPGATYLSGGTESSVRRLLVDFIEEYGRHTGHADLIREAVDGRVGEDPPGRPFPYALS